MPEGIERKYRGPRKKTRIGIEEINKRSRDLGRPLTVSEAVKAVRELPEYASVSPAILDWVRRHSLVSVQVAQGTKNRPMTRNLEERIKLSVQKIQESGGVPSHDVVAQELEMTEAQMTAWFNNHGFTAKDFDVITHNEKRRLLYLSMGEIFHQHDLKFSLSLLAQCLAEPYANVFGYLRKHEDVRQALEAMGLTTSKRGRPRKTA